MASRGRASCCCARDKSERGGGMRGGEGGEGEERGRDAKQGRKEGAGEVELRPEARGAAQRGWRAKCPREEREKVCVCVCVCDREG